MSLLASWLASPPLDAAIEIAPEAVSIAVLGGRGQNAVVQGYAVEPMPSGAVVPSLLGVNMPDRDAVVRALRTACDSVGVRPRRVALVVPDLVGKVAEHPHVADGLPELVGLCCLLLHPTHVVLGPLQELLEGSRTNAFE